MATNSAALGFAVWQNLTHVTTLTRVMRSTDPTFANVLASLRTRKSDAERAADRAWLNSRVVSPTLTPPRNTLILVSTNFHRQRLNDACLRAHARSLNQPIYRLVADIGGVSQPLSHASRLDLFATPDSSSERIPLFFDFTIGSPISLSKNRAPTAGEANGARGIIRAVHWAPGTTFNRAPDGTLTPSSLPLAIIIEPDLPRHHPLPHLPPTWYPVTRQTSEHLKVEFKDTFEGRNRSVTLTNITQIPMTLNYATTAYRVQGQTVPSIFVASWTSAPANFLYVAVSRVTSPDGVFLATAPPARILRACGPSDDLIAEMDRLHREYGHNGNHTT